MDPAGEPGQALDALGELAKSGVTIAYASVRSRSLSHYLEQLEALAPLGRQVTEGS